MSSQNSTKVESLTGFISYRCEQWTSRFYQKTILKVLQQVLSNLSKIVRKINGLQFERAGGGPKTLFSFSKSIKAIQKFICIHILNLLPTAKAF